MLKWNQFPPTRSFKTWTREVFRAKKEDFPSAVGPSVVSYTKSLRQGKALNLGNLALVKKPVQSREKTISVLLGLGAVLLF